MCDEVSEVPWCRATITRHGITLNAWTPQLVRGGPTAMVLDRLDGVVIADLYATGDEGNEELIVRFVSPAPHSAPAIEVLIAWARTVGYRRLWMPARVVALEPPPEGLGVAVVKCPTCGLSWRDDSPSFWRHVCSAGAFPGYCVACGGSLPEWRVRERQPAEPSTRRRSMEGRT